MSKENKKGRGQPSKYKPEYNQMVIDHMSEGHSFDSFAGCIGVSRDTVREWCHVHEDFSDAKNIGQARGIKKLERIGLDIIDGKSRNKNFNLGVWVMFMRNIGGWYTADKREDQDQNNNLTINLAYKKDE